ncbi:MAG: hypothetical protein PHP50_04325 [Lachnospiraceae bacterium]|nr:hypothetical protein [Lachnospiraceae bacterium]
MKKLDQSITTALYDAGNQVQASPALRERIKEQINNQISQPDMEEFTMKKHISKKKLIIGTLAACFMVSMSCFAAGKITGYVSHRNPFTASKDFSDLEKVKKKAGYDIKAVESFTNGYEFTSLNSNSQAAQVADGNNVKEGIEINLEYTKDGNRIALYTDTLYSPEENTQVPQKTMDINGITVAYNQDTYKFVPPDYELTEEDKANEQKDHYFISCGSDEVEIQQAYSVSWVDNGVNYDLFAFDLELTPEKWFQMAEEIINQ